MRLLSRRSARLLVAAALCVASPVLAGDPRGCLTTTFGDFDAGLKVWTITTTPSERGDADTSATIEIVDASDHQSLSGEFPFDASTLQISVSAAAGQAGGVGTAHSSVQMSMNIAAFGDVLAFEVGGDFGHEFLGGAGHGIELVVDVDGPFGGHASHVIHRDVTAAARRCGPGGAVRGTLDREPATVVIDLEAAGMQWGEYIDVTIRATAVAASDLPCQSAASHLVALLDNFRICERFSRFDLNEDGQVNGLDLALLLGQWGPCPVCPSGPCPCEADFDFTAAVNGQDLAMLLGAWAP